MARPVCFSESLFLPLALPLALLPLWCPWRLCVLQPLALRGCAAACVLNRRLSCSEGRKQDLISEMKSTLRNTVSPRKRPPDLPAALLLHFCRLDLQPETLAVRFTEPLHNLLLLLPWKRAVMRSHAPSGKFGSCFNRNCFSFRLCLVDFLFCLCHR